jgi:hypothetical protein
MVDSQLFFNKSISITNEIDSFVIKKDSTKITLNKQTYNISNQTSENSSNKPEQFYAIVGVLDTRSNSYLVCVNGADYIGNILSSRVFKITEVY